MWKTTYIQHESKSRFELQWGHIVVDVEDLRCAGRARVSVQASMGPHRGRCGRPYNIAFTLAKIVVLQWGHIVVDVEDETR